MIRSHSVLSLAAFVGLWAGLTQAADLQLLTDGAVPRVRVLGDADNDWRIQRSPDFVSWTNVSALGTLVAGDTTNAPAKELTGLDADAGFFRAVRTDGLYDPTLLRTFSLNFTFADWATRLTSARTAGTDVLCTLSLDNGVSLTGVGSRYKGNTSFTMAGAKKSINVTVNYTNDATEVLGYETFNLNNSAGDNTIAREPIYFTVMARYTPAPKAALAQLYINGANWGVYSLAQNGDSDLIKDWFPNADGDRWRAPNAPAGGGGPGGGGGGMFSGAGSALTYVGPNLSSYKSNYELRHTADTNRAWLRLTNAIFTLHFAFPAAADFYDKVDSVLATDTWCWFLALENIFTDDDSYWNKGADYGFYYEPESGCIAPVEHDGNEAFTAGDVTLSPLVGFSATGGSARLNNRPLLYRLLGNEELRQRYLAHMRTVLEENYNPTVMTPLINQFHQLSIAAIVADPNKGFTLAAYTNDLVALRTHVTNRYNFLRTNAALTPVPPAIVSVSDPAVLPTATEVGVVTAVVQAVGTNGLDSVWLYHRGADYGKFAVNPMFDDGAHGDGAAGDGTFGGFTTNYPAGTKVRYYVEARSANPAKAARFFPARAERDTDSYRVAITSASNSVVVINELLADNESGATDPQGEREDWIELRNLSDSDVDLTGCHLSDEANNPRKWQFPSGTVIPANGYLVVWADKDTTAMTGLHASFKLSKSGEQVFLTDTDANLNAVLDSVVFGAQTTDQSYGRTAADADVWSTMAPTPGSPNP